VRRASVCRCLNMCWGRGVSALECFGSVLSAWACSFDEEECVFMIALCETLYVCICVSEFVYKNFCRCVSEFIYKSFCRCVSEFVYKSCACECQRIRKASANTKSCLLSAKISAWLTSSKIFGGGMADVIKTFWGRDG